MQKIIVLLILLFSFNVSATVISTQSSAQIGYNQNFVQSVTLTGLLAEKVNKIYLVGAESSDAANCVDNQSSDSCSFNINSNNVLRNKNIAVYVFSDGGMEKSFVNLLVDDSILDSTFSNIKVYEATESAIEISLSSNKVEFGVVVLDKSLYKKIYLKNEGVQQSEEITLSLTLEDPNGLLSINNDNCSGKKLKEKEVCSFGLLLRKVDNSLIPDKNDGKIILGNVLNSNLREIDVFASVKKGVIPTYEISRDYHLGGHDVGDRYTERIAIFNRSVVEGAEAISNSGAHPLLQKDFDLNIRLRKFLTKNKELADIYFTAPASFSSFPTSDSTSSVSSSKNVDIVQGLSSNNIYLLYKEEIDYCLFLDGVFVTYYRGSLDASNNIVKNTSNAKCQFGNYLSSHYYYGVGTYNSGSPSPQSLATSWDDFMTPIGGITVPFPNDFGASSFYDSIDDAHAYFNSL